MRACRIAYDGQPYRGFQRQPDGTGTERSLATDLAREGPFLVCRFRAGGFPRQFVRRAVSVVAEVTRGEATLDRVDRLLSPTPATGPDGVPPAPPEPLVLTAVTYPDAEFTVDGDPRERTRQLFDDLRVERAAATRVAGVLAGVGDTHREQ